jgi:hypothetical protein
MDLWVVNFASPRAGIGEFSGPRCRVSGRFGVECELVFALFQKPWFGKLWAEGYVQWRTDARAVHIIWGY